MDPPGPSADAGPAVPAGPVVSYPPGGGGGPAIVDLDAGDVCKDWSSEKGEVVINGWDPYVWLPGGVDRIRCLVGGASYLRELARIHHCGYIRQPPPNPETLMAVLKKYGEMSGHPELGHVQIVGSGYSAAYGALTKNTASKISERFLALFGGGIHTASPKAFASLLRVPWLSFNGNRDSAYIPAQLVDMGSNHPWWAHNVAVAGMQGGLFGHAVRWGRHHEVGDSRHLMFSFYHQIIALRTPKPGAPITALPKVELRREDGWLVSTENWDSAFPSVAPYADWKGDRSKASWTPDAFVAHALRAYTAKDSPVRLIQPPCKGDQCVPRSAGTKSLVPVEVEVTGEQPEKIELYDGGKLVATMPGPPWQVTMTDLPVGVHAFNAVATFAGGTKAVSNLRSVLVARPRGTTPCAPATDAAAP